MQDADQQLLRDAIERNAPAVVSLPPPDGAPLRHHKTRFLADGGDGFWLESVPGERDLIESLIGAGQPCGVSFKSDHTKIVFSTPLIARQGDYRLTPTVTTEALLLAFPSSVKAVHRRDAYRVDVPAVFAERLSLSLKMWRIPTYVRLTDKPAADPLLTALRDLSVGGVGVTIASGTDEPPKVGPNDRLRIELTCGPHAVVLEGRIVYPADPIDTPSARAGIRFKPPGNDMASRQAHQVLTRIMGELQRAEVRHHRLGGAAKSA